MATATPIDSEYSRSVDLRANDRCSSMRSSSTVIALRTASKSVPPRALSTSSAALLMWPATPSGMR